MRLLIAALALCATLPPCALAQEETVTWYDVEIIVFRQAEARSNETWPPDAGVPDIASTRPLFPPPASEGRDDEMQVATTGLADTSPLQPEMPVPYVPLAPDAYQMSSVYGSLQRSSRYEPLLHVAWTQPPLERSQAPYLRLTLPGTLAPPAPDVEEDADTALDEPLLGRETDNGRLPATTRTNDDRDPLIENDSWLENGVPPAFLEEDDDQGENFARPLDGRVQLSVSRYLHLDLDLLYLPDDIDPELLNNIPAATTEWTEEDRRNREQRRRFILDMLAAGNLTLEEAEILSIEPEREVFQGFRLNQFRRLRSRELHYFDHPIYGVIVTVTPREVSARLLNGDDAGATDSRL